MVGVHSPKFPSERTAESVRMAVQRQRVGHPVVNDPDHRVWTQYGVRAWPTLIFVDPEGRAIGKQEGELQVDALLRLVGAMVAEFDAAGLLQRRPHPSPLSPPPSPLAFPGKVLADPASGRLFIADSGHHRVIQATTNGEVVAVYGSEEPGLADGGPTSSRFHHPQGLAVAGQSLYVADTENHVLRRIDLATGHAETVAGTGTPGNAYGRSGPAREIELSSPWDLALHGGILYVAMAGLHQVWSFDPVHARVGPWAGSGREGRRDGPREQAWLAQPSGITAGEDGLYVADSEVSAVRHLPTRTGGQVSTVVGLDLFVFGDVDGVGDIVRLQHPLGICWHEGVLYVADSYNHKIKQLFPRTRGVTTFVGMGQPGFLDGPGAEAQLHEPAGVSAAGGSLYIADTNNHAIRVVDLATREVRTLELRGL